jgi:hypothetical protein
MPQSAKMMSDPQPGEYIRLAEAARESPGTPTPNALWRWCRRGVKVRGSQQRVRLQHVRSGGRVFTTRAWLHEFLRSAAEADLKHFDRQLRPKRVKRPRLPQETRRRREIEMADAKNDRDKC